MIVFAADDASMKWLMERLPKDDRFPMKLNHHSAFHSPLLDHIVPLAKASNPLGDFGTGTIPAIDGTGRVWSPKAFDPAAIYEASFSVGATISASDNLASFSSRGPVTVDGSNRMKPNISAPGVNVRSSLPGGVYGSKNGTSMAGPHVAGGVALLMSAYPALVGQPGLVQTRLERSAVQRTATVNCGGTGTAAPNNEFGWGRLYVKAAYDAPFATLDVDNNGVSEASKDGVLIVRYLLGMRGSALTSGVIGAGARRSSTVAIETYLGTLLL